MCIYPFLLFCSRCLSSFLFPYHVLVTIKVEDGFGVSLQVVEMEEEVLKFFNYEMSSPTTKTFLR